jgi:hypothetical protein
MSAALASGTLFESRRVVTLDMGHRGLELLQNWTLMYIGVHYGSDRDLPVLPVPGTGEGETGLYSRF